MIKIPECGSLSEFYLCVKENMKDFRGSNDVEKILKNIAAL